MARVSRRWESPTAGIAAIAIHGRTRADRFSGAAEYETIRERRFAAQLAGSIESSSTGQGLRILEEPDYPEKPHKPNRKLLVLASLALSVWAGMGTALIQEHYDDRIWTVEDVAAELSEQPLSVIPTSAGYVPKPPGRGQPIAKAAG